MLHGLGHGSVDVNVTEHRRRFQTALDRARADAEAYLGGPIPERVAIELHGAGARGELLAPEEVMERTFLGEDRAYALIDVVAKVVELDHLVVFVRVAQYAPRHPSEIWDPDGIGPFKNLLAVGVPDRRPRASNSGAGT